MKRGIEKLGFPLADFEKSRLKWCREGDQRCGRKLLVGNDFSGGVILRGDDWRDAVGSAG